MVLLAVQSLACVLGLGWLLHCAARRRAADARLPLEPPVPDKLEPPAGDYPALEGHPADEIFSIMAEFYPDHYSSYSAGALDSAARRWAWDASCAIYDARFEIQELCR